MAALGELVVSLSANTAKFTEGLNKADYQAQKAFSSMKAKVGMLGTAIAGAFTTQAIFDFTKQAIIAADAISDVAKANDVAVSSVLNLSRALSLNGGEASSASNLFASLTKSIDAAADGSEKTQASFKKVGISLQDLATLDGQDIFNKTIDGLGKIEDPVKRNALAMELMGKAVKGVDINGLSEDFANGKDDFRDSEKAFNDIGVALDKLDKIQMQTSTSLATALGPALLKTIEIAEDVGPAILESIPVIGQMVRLIDQLNESNANLGKQSQSGKIKFNTPTIQREVIDPAAEKAKEEAEKRRKEAAKAAADLRKKLSEEQLRDIQNDINFELDLFEAKNKQEIELEKDKEEERRQLIADTVEKQKEFNAEVERVKDSVDPLRQYNVEIGKLAEMFNMGRITAEEFSVASANAQKEMLGFTENGKDKFDELKNAIDGFSRDAADAMTDFIFGTKGSFSDMINSMLKDLARLALQRSLFDPIVNGLANSFEGGGFGNWLSGTLFGGGRAQGGDVKAGRSYLVGEYGPEVVTMGGNGTVTPNTGGNVSVSVNVDATGGSVESNESFGKQLGNAIKSTVQAELLKQKRQGGILA